VPKPGNDTASALLTGAIIEADGSQSDLIVMTHQP
jgi:2-succinyl-5-enolpyruvyl-6-hydroxy-3-cyclohexene-1-carboxylate synthase